MDENICNETCEETEMELAEAKTEKKGCFSERMGKILDGAKKIGTKNIVVLSSLVLIGGAVILNFLLFGNSKPVVTEGEPLAGEENEGKADASFVEDTYFASAELNRKQARDQAIAVLQTVVESSTADNLSKEQATADIGRIVSEIQMEANIETLIKSKGFEECVAVIGEGSASVIVRSDGLLPNELSQIKEIVYEEAGIDPVSIKIIEQNKA